MYLYPCEALNLHFIEHLMCVHVCATFFLRVLLIVLGKQDTVTD